MQTVGDFLVALIVYGGGPVVIAFAVFRFLGEKWMESKFAAQLEAERHQHAKELHELRKKLDSELSRIVKLQDREFAVLSQAWEYLQAALSQTTALLSIFRSNFVLSGLSPERLDEILAASPLTEVHKDEVRQADDKTKHYKNLMVWYDLHEAKKACQTYRVYVENNSIFLREELNTTFQRITGLLWEALISREIGEEAKDTKLWVEASQKMRADMEPLLRDLHSRVQAVLRGAE